MFADNTLALQGDTFLKWNVSYSSDEVVHSVLECLTKEYEMDEVVLNAAYFGMVLHWTRLRVCVLVARLLVGPVDFTG